MNNINDYIKLLIIENIQKLIALPHLCGYLKPLNGEISIFTSMFLKEMEVW